jgi:hypothetical protein
VRSKSRCTRTQCAAEKPRAGNGESIAKHIMCRRSRTKLSSEPTSASSPRCSREEQELGEEYGEPRGTEPEFSQRTVHEQ